MSTSINDGTNVTRPSDLAESTRGLRFLSPSETSFFSTVTSFGRGEFETGTETLEDLRGHMKISCGLLDRDDI